MRQEKFKMERQGLIHIGDEVEISEFQSYMNYSYIIEPAVAMSGCYKSLNMDFERVIYIYTTNPSFSYR